MNSGFPSARSTSAASPPSCLASSPDSSGSSGRRAIRSADGRNAGCSSSSSSRARHTIRAPRSATCSIASRTSEEAHCTSSKTIVARALSMSRLNVSGTSFGRDVVESTRRPERAGYLNERREQLCPEGERAADDHVLVARELVHEPRLADARRADDQCRPCRPEPRELVDALDEGAVGPPHGLLNRLRHPVAGPCAHPAPARRPLQPPSRVRARHRRSRLRRVRTPRDLQQLPVLESGAILLCEDEREGIDEEAVEVRGDVGNSLLHRTRTGRMLLRVELERHVRLDRDDGHRTPHRSRWRRRNH